VTTETQSDINKYAASPDQSIEKFSSEFVFLKQLLSNAARKSLIIVSRFQSPSVPK
jgi:hypothetical protein